MQDDPLKSLSEQLARLSERVAALERGGGSSERESQDGSPSRAAVLPAPRSGAATRSPEVDPGDELVVVISAAIAALLGKKPRIRQIRLVGAASWAHQGRVTVQASHALAARHARSSP